VAPALELTDHELEALAMRLAAEHNARRPDQAAVATATALRRWGERVPPALVPTHDELLARHRERWLRDAEAAITTLDPTAFTGGRSLHVLDFADLGAFAGVDADGRTTYGFCLAADLHRLAGSAIPKRITTTPAAAVAVNVGGIVRTFKPNGIDDFPFIRAVVAAVGIHEYAHLVDAAAAGVTVSDAVTAEMVREVVAKPRRQTAARARAGHGPQWARAYAHLLHRARQLPYRQTRAGLFASDVEPYAAGGADAVLAALADELAAHTADDPLAEILHAPAPAGFTDLFPAIDDQAEAACDVAASRS
jgi:hypothetical protein